MTSRWQKLLARAWPGATSTSLLLAVLMAGCVGVQTKGEKKAKADQTAIARIYRPGGERPVLPHLATNSPLSDFLMFALLNEPQVEAAYYDWAAAVQRITVERSLPDPRLNFQTDIQDVVMGVMPGLMMDFPGPGKLKVAANIATAESETAYFTFENAMLQTAFALKKAYYELHFLEAKIAVSRDTLRLVGDIEKLARAQNEVGKVSLQDVLRAQIEQERLITEIDNLEDSRNPLLAQFKAALGLKDGSAAPPVPQKFESTPLDFTSDRLFATALTRNPGLKALEAAVRRADASIRLAYKARLPDFNAGIELDVKASPILVTPQIGVTLPIWRDKIAAQIAGAQAGMKAGEARLTAAQIALAVEFAEKSFLYREATRTLELLAERLLPKARQSLEVAQSGYVSGKVDFLNLLDAERTLLEFQLDEVEARVQRELALAEVSLIILGTQPAGATVLPPGAASAKERKS